MEKEIQKKIEILQKLPVNTSAIVDGCRVVAIELPEPKSIWDDGFHGSLKERMASGLPRNSHIVNIGSIDPCSQCLYDYDRMQSVVCPYTKACMSIYRPDKKSVKFLIKKKK